MAPAPQKADPFEVGEPRCLVFASQEWTSTDLQQLVGGITLPTLVSADNHTLAERIQAQALLLAARGNIIDGLKAELARGGSSRILPLPRN